MERVSHGSHEMGAAPLGLAAGGGGSPGCSSVSGQGRPLLGPTFMSSLSASAEPSLL